MARPNSDRTSPSTNPLPRPSPGAIRNVGVLAKQHLRMEHTFYFHQSSTRVCCHPRRSEGLRGGRRRIPLAGCRREATCYVHRVNGVDSGISNGVPRARSLESEFYVRASATAASRIACQFQDKSHIREAPAPLVSDERPRARGARRERRSRVGSLAKAAMIGACDSSA
jgi:hypothetical protein